MSGIETFSLSHFNGSSIELSTWGASWLSWIVPDRNGVLSDVLLGYPDAVHYVDDNCYMGATVGRFANRIGGASFSLEGSLYSLERNDGENANHGGSVGFHRQLWNGGYEDDKVVFRMYSPHLDGGYPGNMELKITYSFAVDGTVIIDFEGTSDRLAILNLTNHAYFNLSGENDVYKHWMMIPSQDILETDLAFIPTGKYFSVDGTEFDFREAKPIGQDIERDTDQLRWNKGYNHCYVLSREDDRQMKPAATVCDPLSGRQLDVFTTYPGVLFYSAGYLESNIIGKQGAHYSPSQGFCLEAQYFPDAPHHAQFPQPIVSPDRPFHHTTEYRMSVCRE